DSKTFDDSNQEATAPIPTDSANGRKEDALSNPTATLDDPHPPVNTTPAPATTETNPELKPASNCESIEDIKDKEAPAEDVTQSQQQETTTHSPAETNDPIQPVPTVTDPSTVKRRASQIQCKMTVQLPTVTLDVEKQQIVPARESEGKGKVQGEAQDDNGNEDREWNESELKQPSKTDKNDNEKKGEEEEEEEVEETSGDTNVDKASEKHAQTQPNSLLKLAKVMIHPLSSVRSVFNYKAGKDKKFFDHVEIDYEGVTIVSESNSTPVQSPPEHKISDRDNLELWTQIMKDVNRTLQYREFFRDISHRWMNELAAIILCALSDDYVQI
ncbi:gas vesicle protein GvpT, partial [Reticulomyxa filosa]